MGKKKKKVRLDEILLKEGIISEEQIKDALKAQKEHGCKFGSQLLYSRFINETDLVKALSKQFKCEGVVLLNLNIPEVILKFIPSKVAIARKIIPFDYDPENNILKVACEDPNDKALINEINFIAREKKVKLFIAAELVLNTIIAKCYLDCNISPDDNLLLEIPGVASETEEEPDAVTDEEIIEHVSDIGSRGTILLVTDNEYTGQLLLSLLEKDNFKVMITDSADDAINMLGDNIFHTVFIQDTVPGDYIDLIDRLRKLSPCTMVRYFESASSLLLEEDSYNAESSLLINNLDLFTSLLSSKEKLIYNHSGIVGKYVRKLCRRLGLPPKDRLAIINAAYIHDLAKFYYNLEDPKDFRKTIDLTVRLLESLNYSPVVVGMLRSMYIDLKQKYKKRLPIEALGGNILTIVDLFCDNISLNERLSLDKFDSIQKKLHDLTGKLFLSEVVEVFLVMIKEEILHYHTEPSAGQIMILTDHADDRYAIELRLKNEGFRTIMVNKIKSFVELYQRSQPDLIILIPDGNAHKITNFVENLANNGIEFKKTPAFVMVPGSKTSQLTNILEMGIEDVIAVDGNLDILTTKISKIKAQLLVHTRQNIKLSENKSDTRGQLADMNLIDLIQALGPSQRTVKISITNSSKDEEQSQLYLHKGQIIYASMNEHKGIEAVYETISWTDGSWTIDTICEDELPEPNVNISNEAILMEGCRLLDEKAKVKQRI